MPNAFVVRAHTDTDVRFVSRTIYREKIADGALYVFLDQRSENSISNPDV